MRVNATENQLLSGNASEPNDMSVVALRADGALDKSNERFPLLDVRVKMRYRRARNLKKWFRSTKKLTIETKRTIAQ